jgi:hypothetical protein
MLMSKERLDKIKMRRSIGGEFRPNRVLVSMANMLMQTDVVQVNAEPDQTSSSSKAPEQMDFYWVPR